MNLTEGVLMIIAVIVLCVADYAIKRNKMKNLGKGQLEKVYRKRDGLEAYFGVISTIYLSVIFYMLNYVDVWTFIYISIAVAIYFIQINVMIYKYKIRIRELEK